MEEIIQLLVNRYIDYSLRKVEVKGKEQQILIYIKDSNDSTIYRISVGFEVNRERVEYSWYDLRGPSMVELIGVPKVEILEKIKQIDLKEVYKIEE